MSYYVVYRHLPGIPHRQYLRRIIHGTWVLWHRDPHVALRMEHKRAAAWAATMKQRSVGSKGHVASEPAGEYGVQEVTP